MTDQEIRLKFGELNAGEMRQPILADDGRSLGQVAYDKYTEYARLRSHQQCLELVAQKVAAVVLAQAVRRMESVPVEELEKVYWDGNKAVSGHTALKRVRARLIAAAKGDGQAQGVPQAEPDPYARLKAYAKAGARIRINGSLFLKGINWDWSNPPSDYVVHPDDLHMCPEYAPQVEAQSWTPAVGDIVRLKSGGPAMTVTGVDPLSLMCAWMNADNELQVEPITTLCLAPAKP